MLEIRRLRAAGRSRAGFNSDRMSPSKQSGGGAGSGPLPDDLVVPHPDRVSPDAAGFAEICERHAAAIAAGQAMYEDPSTGLWVMTAAALWARRCCENLCRHCPHLAR